MNHDVLTVAELHLVSHECTKVDDVGVSCGRANAHVFRPHRHEHPGIGPRSIERDTRAQGDLFSPALAGEQVGVADEGRNKACAGLRVS